MLNDYPDATTTCLRQVRTYLCQWPWEDAVSRWNFYQPWPLHPKSCSKMQLWKANTCQSVSYLQSWQLSVVRVWSAYLVMTQMCLSYLCKGCIWQTCIARYSWSAGMDQYLISMPPVQTLVRNACSYQVRLRASLWYNFLPFRQGKCHYTEYYDYYSIWKRPRFSYFRCRWYMYAPMHFFVALYSQPPDIFNWIWSLLYIHKEEEES